MSASQSQLPNSSLKVAVTMPASPAMFYFNANLSAPEEIFEDFCNCPHPPLAPVSFEEKQQKEMAKKQRERKEQEKEKALAGIINNLNQECADYKKYLSEKIKFLSDLWCSTDEVVDTIQKPNEADRLRNERNTRFKELNLAIEKYCAIKELQDSLKGEAPPSMKIQIFTITLTSHTETLKKDASVVEKSLLARMRRLINWIASCFSETAAPLRSRGRKLVEDKLTVSLQAAGTNAFFANSHIATESAEDKRTVMSSPLRV